jgi:hypothetical protein
MYDEINQVFQRVFNVPLEKTLTTFPTLNIQVKKSCAEKKKKRLFTRDKLNLFGGALEEYISYEVNRLNTVCLWCSILISLYKVLTQSNLLQNIFN